jgi:hypothetical protein
VGVLSLTLRAFCREAGWCVLPLCVVVHAWRTESSTGVLEYGFGAVPESDNVCACTVIALDMSLRNGSDDVQSHMAGGQAASGSCTDHGQGCSSELKPIHGCCFFGLTLCCPGLVPVVCVLQMMMRELSPLQGLQQQRQEAVLMLRMCVGRTPTWLSG